MVSMDPSKRSALLEWINALKGESAFSSLIDLQDGKFLISLIKLSDDSQEYEPSTVIRENINFIKTYVEGFYGMSFDGIFNVELISTKQEQSLELEWEIAKVLVSLLGVFVQDNQRQLFTQAAISLQPHVQTEICLILEATIKTQDPTTQISADFADFLKQKTDSTAHLDADIFFKLVLNQSRHGMMSTPTLEQSFNFPSRTSFLDASIKGSPIPYHAANCSIQEISSPLRMLTIANSPVTPLGALMQSPQLAQKALLRQKEKEIKKLRLQLDCEKHLTSDLELDISDKTNLLQEKENKIREMENALKQQWKVKDMEDELCQLRSEREEMEKELNRCHILISNTKDVKEEYHILKTENKEYEKQIEGLKSEVLLFEGLKKNHDELSVKCRKQSMRIQDLELNLERSESEMKRLDEKLKESEEIRQNILIQKNQQKQEIEELEEKIAVNGFGVHQGESMNVVTDIKIREIEDELSNLRNTWIAPIDHDAVKTELVEITEIKERLEAVLQTVTVAKDQADDNVRRLEKELMYRAEEIETLKREAENSKLQYENRRQTLTASLDEVTCECKMLEEKLNKERSTYEEKLENLNVKLHQIKEEKIVSEDCLQSKLNNCTSQLKQTETLLENERHTKDCTIKGLKEEIKSLQEDIAEAEDSFLSKIQVLKQSKEALENQLLQEKKNFEDKFEQLTVDMDTARINARNEENKMLVCLEQSQDECKRLTTENERLLLEQENLVKRHDTNYSKMERKLKDEVDSLTEENSCLSLKNEESGKKCDSLCGENIELKQTVTAKDDFIMNLQQQLRKLESDLSKVNEDFNQENAKNVDLYETLNRKELEFEQQRFDHDKIVEELHKSLKETKGSSENQLQQERKQYQLTIEELTSDMASLRSKASSEEKTILASLEESRAECRRMVTEQEKLIKDHTQVVKGYELRYTDLQVKMTNEVEGLRIEMSCLNDKYENSCNKCENLVTEISELKQTVSAKEDSILCVQQQLQKVEAELCQSCANIDSEKERSNGLCESLNKMRSEFEEQTSQHAQIVQELESSHKQALAVLEKQLMVKEEEKMEVETSFQKEIENLRCSLSELNEKYNLSETDLKQKCTEIESQTLHMKVEEEKLRDLTTKLQQIQEDKVSAEDCLKAELQRCESQLKEKENLLESELKNKDMIITLHKEEMQVLKDDVSDKELSLVSEIKSLKESLALSERQLKQETVTYDERLEQLTSEAELEGKKINECLEKSQDQLKKLKSEHEKLKSEQEQTMTSLQNLNSVKVQAEENCLRLEKELVYKQEELQNFIKEAEARKLETEQRRHTMTASIDSAISERNSLQEMLSKEQSTWQDKMEDLTDKLHQAKEEKIKAEKCLETKLHNCESQLKQSEILLENERWTKYSIINALKEEMQGLKDEIAETESNLRNEIKLLKESKAMLENQLIQERKFYEEKFKQLTSDMDSAHSDAKVEEKRILGSLEEAHDKCKEMMTECERLKMEQGNIVKGHENRFAKMERKLNDEIECLREELSYLNDKYENSCNKCENLVTEISELKQTVSAKDDSILCVQQQLQKVEAELCQSCANIDSEKERSNGLCESLNKMRSEFEEHTSQHAQIVQELESSHKQALAVLEKQLMVKEEEKMEVEKRVKHQESAMTQYKQKCQDQVNGVLSSLEKRETKYKEEIHSMKADNQELKNQEKKLKAELNKLQQINSNYTIHYNNKKEMIKLLNQELSTNKQILKEIQGKHDKEVYKLKAELQSLETQLESTSSEKHKLQVQLDHASNSIRIYKSQLDMAGTVLLGDNSNFKKLQKETDNMELDSTFRCSILPNNTPYNLRSKSRSSLNEDTITQGILDTKSESTRRESSSPTSDLGMSLRSRTRLGSYLDSQLDRSIISTDSGKSLASLPRGTGGLFSCEDEPDMDNDWNRVSELQRRNTLCLPHLKTAYPVETQLQTKCTEKAMRESTAVFASNKKRKQSSSGEESSDSQDAKNKQARIGTVYQKPGPPTPANSHIPTRRSSRGTPKHSLRSPKTPISHKKTKKMNKWTPKIWNNAENEQSAKKSTKKDKHFTFNIGFTPKNRKSSTKVNRKPLGSKNFMQTGV